MWCLGTSVALNLALAYLLMQKQQLPLLPQFANSIAVEQIPRERSRTVITSPSHGNLRNRIVLKTKRARQVEKYSSI